MAEERDTTRQWVRQTAGGCARCADARTGEALLVVDVGEPVGDDEGSAPTGDRSADDVGDFSEGVAGAGMDPEADEDADTGSGGDPVALQLAVATRLATINAPITATRGVPHRGALRRIRR